MLWPDGSQLTERGVGPSGNVQLNVISPRHAKPSLRSPLLNHLLTLSTKGLHMVSHVPSFLRAFILLFPSNFLTRFKWTSPSSLVRPLRLSEGPLVGVARAFCVPAFLLQRLCHGIGCKPGVTASSSTSDLCDNKDSLLGLCISTPSTQEMPKDCWLTDHVTF